MTNEETTSIQIVPDTQGMTHEQVGELLGPPDEQGFYHWQDRIFVRDGDGIFRVLPIGHPNINPFDPRWTARKPYQYVTVKSRCGKQKPYLADADGILIDTAGRPYLKKYPSFLNWNWSRGGMQLARTKPKALRKANWQQAHNELLDAIKSNGSYAHYFNELGQPKPEMALAFYGTVINTILVQPESVMLLFNDVAEKFKNDPMGFLERYQRLNPKGFNLIIEQINDVGSRIQINYGTDADPAPSPTDQKTGGQG